jgi:hypothetical protein
MNGHAIRNNADADAGEEWVKCATSYVLLSAYAPIPVAK